MPQKPPRSFARKDLRFVSTNRLIMVIGAKRYALDIFVHYRELKPSPAEVIPIDEHLGTARKPFER